jgi:hypothetical protein
LVGKLKGSDHFGDRGVYGRIILECNIKGIGYERVD